MSRQNIIVGTMILSASSIFVRMIGFVFKVWLSNTMGTEGIGVYTLIMSLYTVCATLTTSGISGGVAKLAAAEFARGSTANARRILKRALTCSLTLGVSVGVLLFLLAPQIAQHILHDTRTVLSLKLLAPGLPMMAVSGCLRGYFIAARKVSNPALSQLLEQLIKMAFIMALIGYCLPLGIVYTCAVVILGITVGEVACLLVSLLGYVADKRAVRAAKSSDIRGVTKSLLAFALPVSVGSYIRSILRLFEDVLIIDGLRAFSGQDDVATGTYGLLRGMVMPLLVFPLSLLSAFVVTLTPEISRMSEAGPRLDRAVSKVLQFTSMLGIFIVCVFLSFSSELGMLFYKSAEAGEMLRALSWLCPFMCIEMVAVSILQGLGRQVSSLRYNVLDCFLRIGLVYALIPRFGVNGFLWMVVASNLFTSLLNLWQLHRITRLTLRPVECVLKPALAALASTQMLRLVYNYFAAWPDWLVLGVGLLVIGSVYLLTLLGLGCITTDDFRWAYERIRKPGKTPPVEKPV